MSYVLTFWKYKKDQHQENHLEISEKCSDGEILEELETLDTAGILNDICIMFSEWKTEDNESFISPDEKSTFQIFYTSQFFRFDCYQVTGEDMNVFIDIFQKDQSSLYDPQTNKRYT